MKKIIFTRSDGGLSVVHPAAGNRLAQKFLTAFGVHLLSLGKAVPVEQITRKWRFLGTPEWAESENEFVARIMEKAVPSDAINPQIVEADSIPTDRTFRNAWKTTGDRIEHDMPKAREIRRNQLRALRMPKLEALDVAYLLADERGDIAEKQRIVAQKQVLRNVTADPAIEAAQTPEELKAVMPDVLK